MAAKRTSVSRKAKAGRPSKKIALRTKRTTVFPPSGALPTDRKPEVDVVSDQVVRANINREENHQRHEHKSARYREIFTFLALLIILVVGLYWTSQLEKSQLAELGKYIVTTFLVAAIAYVFASNNKS